MRSLQTIEALQDGAVFAPLETSSVVTVEVPAPVTRALGGTMLTGVEAAQAQFANLTVNVRPVRLPYFAV